MKHSRLFLLAMMVVVLAPQVASGEESLKQQVDLRKPSGLKEDSVPEYLRSALKSPRLPTVSNIFAKSKKTAVKRGRLGHVRILVGDVRDELLKTKIKLVTFTSSERYNVREAIIPIIRSKEVQARLRTLRVEQPLTALSGRVLEPDPRLPHLPASMKNVTMEEALDRVAQTFGGFIIYGGWTDAEGTRLFTVDFARVAAFEQLTRRSR